MSPETASGYPLDMRGVGVRGILRVVILALLVTAGSREPVRAQPSAVWTPLPVQGAPSPRAAHVARWTGEEMLIWGGWNGQHLRDGARYNARLNAWRPIASEGAPTLADASAVVWTGEELLVWGGWRADRDLIGDGARYRPAGDTWRPIAVDGAPRPRSSPTVVWTGDEMIVWGGNGNGGVLTDGARYAPSTDTWTPISTEGAPDWLPVNRAVWSGAEILVWARGGSYRYNPRTDTWGRLSAARAPSGRINTSVVWTGDELIQWGGLLVRDGPCFNDGGRYDPMSDTWVAMSTGGALSQRFFPRTFWIRSELWIWGGSCGPGFPTDGAAYLPATDSWRPLPAEFTRPLAGSPSTIPSAGIVWTGEEFIYWGGRNSTGFQGTGARYRPEPAPTPVPVRPVSRLTVLGQTPVYSVGGDPLWIAQPGERYRVRWEEDGWLFVLREGDLPEWSVWIGADDKVEVTRS